MIAAIILSLFHHLTPVKYSMLVPPSRYTALILLSAISRWAFSIRAFLSSTVIKATPSVIDLSESRGDDFSSACAAGVLQPERPCNTVAAPALKAVVRRKFLRLMVIGFGYSGLVKLGDCKDAPRPIYTNGGQLMMKQFKFPLHFSNNQSYEQT